VKDKKLKKGELVAQQSGLVSVLKGKGKKDVKIILSLLSKFGFSFWGL
jgi:hypothetical protein